MSDNEGKLIQIGEVRTAKQEDLKREYERILFGRILGCYTIAETTGMKAVEIVDISKSGISFKMDPKGSFYNIGEDVDLRLYFSAKTYLAVKVNVKRVQENEENSRNHFLYGCTFDTTLKSYSVIDKLVDFITSYSEQARKEDGTEKILLF
ncbi:MAG: PilZ domain-containing protein [bacterium]